jgi:hypothetical protein
VPAPAGQHPVALEGGDVGAGADQHRRPGGRPQHARRGDRGADEAVDQRGLAGPGRAADDGEQRGVEVAQPGQQVVVDLLDHPAGRASGSLAARRGQAERGGRDGVPQGREGLG